MRIRWSERFRLAPDGRSIFPKSISLPETRLYYPCWHNLPFRSTIHTLIRSSLFQRNNFRETAFSCELFFYMQTNTIFILFIVCWEWHSSLFVPMYISPCISVCLREKIQQQFFFPCHIMLMSGLDEISCDRYFTCPQQEKLRPRNCCSRSVILPSQHSIKSVAPSLYAYTS